MSMGAAAAGSVVAGCSPERPGDPPPPPALAVDATDRLGTELRSGPVRLSGEYRIARTVLLPSDLDITSDGTASIVWTGSDDELAVLSADGSSKVSVRGVRFTGISNKQVAVSARAADGVTVEECEMYDCRVLETGGTGSPAYAEVTPANSSRGIRVLGNTAVGSGFTVGSAAVALVYVNDWEVSGNTISRYVHGIQWWGGDSSFDVDGALANERKCARGLIRNNRVSQVGGGGIWGSMGRDIAIGPDVVEDCGDVGIDPEGCTDVTVTVGEVRRCLNGNLATFYGSTNVRFTGGISDQDDPSWPHTMLNHNTTDDPAFNPDVTVDGLLMTTTRGIGYAGHSGPAQRETISNCRFVNTRLDLSEGNHAGLVVQGNRFRFDLADDEALTAVFVGPVIRGGQKVISSNVVESVVPQPEGSIGIDSFDDDPASSPELRVEQNEIRGEWTWPVRARWEGADARYRLVATVRGNTASALTVSSDGAATPALVSADGNRTPAGDVVSTRT